MRIIPNRDYRLLVAGGIVSQLGDWASRLALALLVYERTGSATAVGLAAALLVLPWLGPGQWLGAQGDRLDRQRLLVLCDWTRAGIFIAIGGFELPLLPILGLVTIAATIDPVFEANRSALLTESVSRDDYADAIQFNVSLDRAAQLVGYASGGALVAWLGAGPTLALNGATFVVSALLLSGVRKRPPASLERPAPSLREAWLYLWQDKVSFVAVGVTMVTVLAGMSIESQAAVYGSVVAELGGAGIGALAAIVPAVTLIGVSVLRTSGSDLDLLRRGLLLTGAFAVAGAIVLGWGRSPITTYVGFGLVGGVFLFSTLANIVVGRRIPDGIRASTFGVIQAMVFVAFSSGAGVGGIASDLLSPSLAASLMMLIAAGVACFGLVSIRRLGSTAHPEGTKVPA